MRITKDRETRRAELVDASIALFLERGYEETMVSNIVKRVGVAQGTFYYYFQTKEDVLEAALEKMLRESVERAARLTADEFQSSSQKIEGLFRMLFSPRGSIEVSPRFSRFLRHPVVHARMEDVRFRMLRGVLKDLIEEGIRCGEFQLLRFPGELAEISLRGVSAFMHDRRPIMEVTFGLDATLEALAEFMERMLGLPYGTLDFRDKVIRRHA